MQAIEAPLTHESLALEMDDCHAPGWAYRVRQLGEELERYKKALNSIYYDDIFDDSMRHIAKEALGV